MPGRPEGWERWSESGQYGWTIGVARMAAHDLLTAVVRGHLDQVTPEVRQLLIDNAEELLACHPDEEDIGPTQADQSTRRVQQAEREAARREQTEGATR